MTILSVDQIPLHLSRLILARLDDVQSLGSAILSHSSFYLAFKESPDMLILDVLLNQIPRKSLNWALASHTAKSVDTRDVSQIRDFLTKWFDQDQSPVLIHNNQFWPGSVTPAVARALSRDYKTIEYFTRDMVEEMIPLSQRYLTMKQKPHAKISENELFRIRRALYLFQMYCTLFQSDIGYQEGRTVALWRILEDNFFGALSPWLIEQLACVHDYLERVLSRGFDDVATHDIQWGARHVDWLSTGTSAVHKQSCLANGLDPLFVLDQARTYESRLRILDSVNMSPRRRKIMLASHLASSTERLLFDFGAPLEDCSQSDLDNQARWPTDGPDNVKSHPYRMWLEAHKGYPLDRVIYNRHHAVLRRCGYVLWDAPENPLDDGTLHKRLRAAREQARLEYLELKQLKPEMRKSWRARAALEGLGGRGYWSNGDISRVRWKKKEFQPTTYDSDDHLTRGRIYKFRDENWNRGKNTSRPFSLPRVSIETDKEPIPGMSP